MRKLRQLKDLSESEIQEIKASKEPKFTICFKYKISYPTLIKILK